MPQRKESFEVRLEGKSSPRALLIFLDGTWNDENGRGNDGAVTNVYKMFSTLSGSHKASNIPHSKRTAKHLGLYFRGVGNDEENIKAIGFYQGAFGAGERNIRDHAYASLCKHYRPGDQICIFGFSRGAASARLLASKLNEHGLPKSIDLHYRQVKNKVSGEREWLFSHYRAEEENSLAVEVTFLGLFDTVGAFGIPINIGPLNFQTINLFRDLTIAPNVKQAVHLVAIDESREAFIPTLANFRDNVDEVWLPGNHGDIGGGYHESELGNIALDYMVKRLQETVANPEVNFSKHIARFLDYDLRRDDFHIHYHGDGFKKDSRHMHVCRNQKPCNLPVKVHHAAIKLQELERFYFAEYYKSFTTRTPIRYNPVNLKALGDNLLLMK
jgi:uncharacterized protein (DUF2235 family)